MIINKLLKRNMFVVASGVISLSLMPFANANVSGSISNNSAKKPNIVFFLVDDFGYGALSATGSDFHETPNIDALFKSGVYFNNGYSACTVCSPSRAAILTGCYPARLHLTDWIAGHKKPHAKLLVPSWNMKIDHERITLPEALKENGYSTVFIGKWHLMPIEQPDLMNQHYPTDHGFDINIGGREWGQPKGRGKYFYPWDMPNVKGGKKGDYLTDKLTDYAVNYIDEHKADKNPFMLYFSYYTVHAPIQAKPKYIAKYKAKLKANPKKYQHKRPEYAAMIQSLDDSVGHVIKKLKGAGVYDNTIIIFTADNGPYWHEYTAGLRGKKGLSFDGGMREPFVIAGPGIKRNVVESTPVIGMDFYPTLLELANIPQKDQEHRDGVSLVPLLKKNSKQCAIKVKERSLFWHYPHYHRTKPYGAVRNGHWKLIEFFENGKLLLFNLKEDPFEKVDLSKNFPRKTAELLKELQEWRKSVGAQMNIVNPKYDKKRVQKGFH